MNILPVLRVEDYLSNVIRIPRWKSLLEEDKLEFLNIFQRHTFIHIYFHNVRMAATEISKRRVPTLDEVVETGFRGDGGVCNEINVFSKLILVSLGFDAYNIVGNMSGGVIPGSHIMTIVRLSPSQLYFLDMASANPLGEPVPIHNLPHSGVAAGYSYEFRNNGHGVYARYQCGGRLMNGDFIDEVKEVPRFEFTLDEKCFEDFEVAMTRIYTDADNSSFLRMPFMFRYTETDSEFVLVRGKTIMVATVDTREVTRFETLDEMKPHVERLFPKLKREDIELAWKVLKEMDQGIKET